MTVKILFRNYWEQTFAKPAERRAAIKGGVMTHLDPSTKKELLAGQGGSEGGRDGGGVVVTRISTPFGYDAHV